MTHASPAPFVISHSSDLILPHAVDNLPPADGARNLPCDAPISRLQSNVKRLLRHIVHHPLASTDSGLLWDRLAAFREAEYQYSLSAAARQAASDALLECLYNPSCANTDAHINDVIGSFTADRSL